MTLFFGRTTTTKIKTIHKETHCGIAKTPSCDVIAPKQAQGAQCFYIYGE